MREINGVYLVFLLVQIMMMIGYIRAKKISATIPWELLTGYYKPRKTYRGWRIILAYGGGFKGLKLLQKFWIFYGGW